MQKWPILNDFCLRFWTIFSEYTICYIAFTCEIRHSCKNDHGTNSYNLSENLKQNHLDLKIRRNLSEIRPIWEILKKSGDLIDFGPFVYFSLLFGLLLTITYNFLRVLIVLHFDFLDSEHNFSNFSDKISLHFENFRPQNWSKNSLC